MKADILATGSELVSPDRVDTNSLWLTAQLNQWGIQVRRKLCLGDDLLLVSQELKTSLSHADLIFITGGLGPTEDDVTRQAVSEALGQQLEFCHEQETYLRLRFEQMGRQMTDNNLRQCYLPSGCIKLHNPLGTAPGFWAEAGQTRLFALPGPPNENQPIFTEQIASLLDQWCGCRKMARRTLKVIGLGESALDQRIAPIYQGCDNPTVGLLFSSFDVEVRLTAVGATLEQADQLNDNLARQFYLVLGDCIYGEGDATLAAAVVKRLGTCGLELGIVDQATGGLVAHRLVLEDYLPALAVAGSTELPSGWLDSWLAASQRRCLVQLTKSNDHPQQVRIQIQGALTAEQTAKIPGKSELWHSRVAQLALDSLRRQLPGHLAKDQGTGS